MIAAPAGTAPPRVNVNVSPPLGSLAVAVKVMAVSSSPDCGPTGSRVGALLPSTTVQVKEVNPLRFAGTPSVSVTVIVTAYGLPADAPGETKPEISPVAALIESPGGSVPPSENTKLFGGRSGSDAAMNTETTSSSPLEGLPGLVTTGARFTSATVTVMVSESLSTGDPSSVTTTSNTYTPGP